MMQWSHSASQPVHSVFLLSLLSHPSPIFLLTSQTPPKQNGFLWEYHRCTCHLKAPMPAGSRWWYPIQHFYRSLQILSPSFHAQTNCIEAVPSLGRSVCIFQQHDELP